MRTALAHLHERLHALQEMLRNFGLALDDVPDAEHEPALVDAMRGAATELESDATLALRAVSGEGGGAAEAVQCQQAMNRMHRSMRELASHQNLLELSRLAAERGGAWRRWAAAVHEALEACEETIHHAAEALLGFWSELAERMPAAAAR
ncbi:MAG TPA: hypothetical protein VF824_18050 [Thermoanaerobaculia bacterium]|jgi:hypothetical protein